MMRLILLLFLAFLAVPHPGFAAEAAQLPYAGSRARLMAPSLGVGKQAGTVVEVRGDALLFTPDHLSTPALVPVASVTSFEVSRGMHSHAGKGARIGFLTGAVTGGLVGYIETHDAHSSDGDFGPVVGAAAAVLTGCVGAGVGALIGSKHHSERWETQRLPIRLGLLPSTGTIGLSLAFTIR
jgi:hypothetical protein